jgi:putative PIN family toxin of toxin-antitoxin system
MATKKLRVILDTNWYISATINRNSRRRLYSLLTNNDIIILFSDELMREYNRVILRDKFKRIVRSDQISRFISLVISKLEIVEITSQIAGSRDPNDNYLLSLAADGHADYIVTGDSDLLVLRKTGQTQIVTLSDFMQAISHKTL